MALLLLLIVAVACSASSSSLSVVRNILLPTNEPQLLPYLLDFSPDSNQPQNTTPCWKLTTNSAAFSNEDDDDSLIVVTPVSSQEEDCHLQFEISVRADSIKKSGLRSLVFENLLNPNEHRRVDVHANLLRTLEIATTTRRLEIDEEQTLTVIGKDQANNVFTSLRGLSFAFQFVGPRAAEHCQFVGPAVHNQIIIRGIKTGRSLVAVSLPNQITTQVELIVARTVSVCPGELVSLPHKLQLDMFQYCLAKKQGCYQRASKEFTWNVQGETEDGGFTLQVQDEAEPTNKAATRVTYSKFASLAHFVAPFPDPKFVIEDCPYVRARLDGKWPALSKHLPREPAFWKQLSHYYLWTHSTWVFMGLLKLENDQFAPLHMSLENFKFKMNDTSLLQFKENFHGTSVFQAGERTGTVKMTMHSEKHGQVDFLVTIMDKVDVQPNKLVVDVNCPAKVKVTGGTGHYRTSNVSKYRIFNSSVLELPAEQREGQFSVKVWDARWDVMETSPRAVVQYEVRQITKFALREGRKLFANVGETVRIHMIGSRAENCCAKQHAQAAAWKFDEKMLQRVEDKQHGDDAAVCAQIAFVAREVGVTEVAIGGLKIEIEVMDPLDFSPQPGVVLTVGCKQSVDVLNVNFASSRLTLDGGAPLTQAKFDITCNAPGTYSHVIHSITKLRTYTKRFTYECIRAASCALELVHGNGPAQRITASHVQLGLQGVHVVPTVWSEDGAKHTQHAKCWTAQLALNGTKLDNNQVALNQLGLATVSASLLDLQCKPLQINVALPFTLPMGNSVQFWADDCIQPEVLLEYGSGKFSSSMFAVRQRTLLISKHSEDARYGAVVIRDEDFFPLVTRTLQVEFFKDLQLTLRAVTEHLVQHSSIEFAVSPSYLDFTQMDTQLTWEPKNMFALESNGNANKFKLFAWQSGQVQVDLSVASTCHKERRVRVQQTFVVHPFRAVALLRGDTYQLSECDGERAISLMGCEIVSFTGENAAFQVNSTGAIAADCREQSMGKTALVHCMPNNQYFELAMASIDQVKISPKHEQWLQNTPANQVHFELVKRDVPQHWPQDKLCRAGEVSANEWRIQVSNAGTHKFTTKQDIVSVFVDKQSTLQVKATVQLGTQCAASVTAKQILNAVQKYTVSALPRVSIGNHVLLPPGSQFDVQASEPVQCKFTCTCMDSIWLENCRVNTARNAGVSSCSLSLYTPSNTEVAFFQSQVEVQPIASLSLTVKQEESLTVTFHDQYTREFTKGWVDGTTKRALFFQVPAPLYLTLDSRVNCSKPFAGQEVAMHVRTGSVKHNVHHPASITVKLQGDDGLVLKASNLMKLQDWQCLGKRHRVLGTCFGFYEYVVMVALAVTFVVLLLQRNVHLMGVFAALIVAIFLW